MKQIRILFLSITFLLVTGLTASAQSVVLCESYDTQGVATGVYTSWEIEGDGSYVYILYNQTYALGEGIWYLYIDKDWDNTGSYTAYETLAMTPEAGKNWYVYDFKFSEAGKYKAMVMKDGIEQASTYFQIDFKEGTAPSTGSTTIDTYYYENSSTTFGTSADSVGNVYGESTSFALDASGSVTVMIYLENDRMPFKTSSMFVDIYKDDAEEPYDSFTINIQPDWDFVKFNEKFTEPGTYVVEFYTADDIYINTTDELTITR